MATYTVFFFSFQTPYDAKVDSDVGSETFGQLRVNNYADVDLYDARLQLPGKFAYIQQRAEQIKNSTTQDIGMCTDLLAQLHTACDKSSCRDGNSQSFQLSVNQVCEAVNTRTVLNVKTAGEFFDFQVYTVNTVKEEVEKTPITERRAVSCCRRANDENYEQWHTSPISQDSSCETLLLPWTGDDSAHTPFLEPYPRFSTKYMFSIEANRDDMFPQSNRYPKGYYDDDYDSLPVVLTGPFNWYSISHDSWKMEIFRHDMKDFDYANFVYVLVARRDDFDMKVFIDGFKPSPTPSDRQKLVGLQIREFTVGIANPEGIIASPYYAILLDSGSGKLVKRTRKEKYSSSIEEESGINFVTGWLRITRTDGIFTAYYSTLQEPSNDDDWNVVLPNSDLDKGHVWSYPSRAGIVMFAGEGDVLMANALSVNEQSVPPTLPGYTPYLQRECLRTEGGGAVLPLQSCATKCDEEKRCVAFNFSPTWDGWDSEDWSKRCVDPSPSIQFELPDISWDNQFFEWTKRALGDSECCASKGSDKKDGVCFEHDGEQNSWEFEIATEDPPKSLSEPPYEISAVNLKIYYQKETPKMILSYNECGGWLYHDKTEEDVVKITTGGVAREISLGMPYYYDEATGVCTRYSVKELSVKGCVNVEIDEIDDENCTNIVDSRSFNTLRPSKMTVGENSQVTVDSQDGCDCGDFAESLGCEPVNLEGNGGCGRSDSGQMGLCRLSTECDHYIRTEFGIADVWYFKDIVPPGYMKYEGRCTEDLPNLLAEITMIRSVQECTNNCGAKYHCRSAAYSETDKKCLLFSSFICDRNKYDIVVSSQWSTYVKNEEEGDSSSNANTCPIVSYDRAEVSSSIFLNEHGFVMWLSSDIKTYFC